MISEGNIDEPDSFSMEGGRYASSSMILGNLWEKWSASVCVCVCVCALACAVWGSKSVAAGQASANHNLRIVRSILCRSWFLFDEAREISCRIRDFKARQISVWKKNLRLWIGESETAAIEGPSWCPISTKFRPMIFSPPQNSGNFGAAYTYINILLKRSTISARALLREKARVLGKDTL